MSKEDNDNVNNNSSNSSGNNAAIETQTGNLNSCTTETEQKLPCENEPKDGIEEVSHSIEKEELEDVKMDTSETDNLILVTNSSVDNSLSDDSKTKEESLDTTINNNHNSNNCQNVDSVK